MNNKTSKQLYNVGDVLLEKIYNKIVIVVEVNVVEVNYKPFMPSNFYYSCMFPDNSIETVGESWLSKLK